MIELRCQKISYIGWLWRRHRRMAAFFDLVKTWIFLVKTCFLRKINVTIGFYVQKLTYMHIFMDFGQPSFFHLIVC